MGSACGVHAGHMSDKRVVIVGGGYAGVSVGMHAQKHFHTTLISDRDHFLHRPGTVRAVVDPKFHKEVAFPITMMKRGELVTDGVERVDKANKQVITKGGRAIKYDYLVIATGCTCAGPVEPKGTTTQEINAAMLRCTEAISNAKKILVVGGGPTGVEIAGEIMMLHGGSKKVTLVTNASRLVPAVGPETTTPESFSEDLKESITSQGGEVLLNTRTKGLSPSDFGDAGFLAGERTVEMENGTKVQTDLVIWCVGVSPNTQFVRDSGLASWVDDKGFINVDKHMRVVGEQHVWAAGDVANTGLPKTGAAAGTKYGRGLMMRMMMAEGTPDWVLANIIAEDQGKPPSKSCRPAKVELMVPVGKKGSTVGAPKWALGMKRGDLFVGVTKDFVA